MIVGNKVEPTGYSSYHDKGFIYKVLQFDLMIKFIDEVVKEKQIILGWNSE